MTVRSQNGWTAKRPDLLAWFTVPGTHVRLRLRRDYAGPLLIEVARLWHRDVERLVEPGCWSYADRPVRGGTSLSNHASGTAIDLNAPKHPLGSRGTFSPDQVRAIRRILAAAGGTVRWGGDYSGRPDEMHLELHTTDIGRVVRATDALRRL